MITCQDIQHGATINDLAERGVIAPVRFTYKDHHHTANSVWAATEWLKRNGAYVAGAPKVTWWS